MAILLNSDGVIGEVPDEQAEAALAQGYAPAPPEQAAAFLDARQRRETFGTTGQALLAGGEAAARALTLGGSTFLERAIGVSPESIQAREEVNPLASGLGTVAGIAAPLVLSGGSSALAQGGRGALAGAAELSAPSLVSRAGRAVVGALEGTGAELGVRTPGLLPQATSFGGQLARRAVAEGLGSAVEGAAYGAGEVVHEAALGNPDLTAQSALGTVGMSALVGGGLGAGIGGASAAGRGLVDRLSGASGTELGGKLAGWLKGVEGERNIKAAGAIQSDLTRVRKQIGRERLNELGVEMGELGLVGVGKTPERTAELAQALKKTTGAEIGDVVAAADSRLPFEKMPQIADFVGKAKVDILDPLASNPLQQEAAGRLAQVLDGYAVKFSGGMTLKDLHGIRQQIDEALYGLRGNQDPFATAFKDGLHDLRGIASKELDDGLVRAGVKGDEWKALRRKYEVASRALEFADKGMDRAGGNNMISLTEIMSGLGGGVAGGPLAGVAATAGAALLRRQSSAAIGSLARAARNALGDEGSALVGTVAREVAPPFPPNVTRLVGSSDTRIVTPTRPQGELARYELVEADDLIASHKPDSFAARREYPKGVQERLYHLQPEEQRKVVLGSQNFNPALVLADTPSAVDGPPIVTGGARQFVLGGNGRTMMMQRAFADPAKLEGYRAALVDRAPTFGLSADAVRKMRKPVLVRVVDSVPSGAEGKDLVSAVRRYNEGLTQALSPRARAVADAKALGPSTVNSIGDLFADAGDKSLRDLLRERPRDFVEILQRDGIINAQNRAAWVAGNTLTDEAKDRVEGMFLGRVVGTGERLSAAEPAVLNRVERATPHLMRVEGINPSLGEIPTVQAAMDLMSAAARTGQSVDDLLRQQGLKGMGGGAKADAATRAMVEILQGENQLEIGARFAKWAREAAIDPRQGMMFGKPPTPVSARKVLLAGKNIDDAALAERVVMPEAVPALPVEVAAAPPTPKETVAVLASLERTGAKVGKKIDTLASTLVRAGVKAGNIAREEVLAGLASEFAHDLPRAKIDFTRQADQIRTLAGDPAAMMQSLDELTDDLHEHAPDTAQAIGLAHVRGVMFLASKLPQPPPARPLGPKWEPSRAEIAQFQRYAVAVDEPLSILKQASAGTLTPEGVEAVKTVYPDLYESMQTKVIEALTRHPDVPYRSRQMLGMLLGMDLDGSRAGMAANQAAMRAEPSAPSQQAPSVASKATPARADSLNVAQRTETSWQRTAAR